MQKSHYSKKEKIGWFLISIIPLWILIALLWIPIWKLLSIIGFSETLSNNLWETISSIWWIIVLLWIICTPIWIIKVIRVLRTQKELSNNDIKLEKIKRNLTEDPQVKTIKKLMVWILLIFVLLTIITSIIVNEE